MFYFVHSYFVKCETNENEIAHTEYGLQFPSIVVQDNIVDIQFHPGISHGWEEEMIQNFCKMYW